MRMRGMSVLRNAGLGLLVIALGLCAPVAAHGSGGLLVEPQCTVHTSSSCAGGGCCNKEPPVCDYFLCTFEYRCWGTCPIPTMCVTTATGQRVVYWYQQCDGDCSAPNPPWNSCVWDPNPTVNYAEAPSACECVESDPYSPEPKP